MLSLGCEKEASSVSLNESDESGPLPKMMIGDIDRSQRLIGITITNPTDKEMIIPGAEGHPVYGAYWFAGDKVVSVPDCGTGFWDTTFVVNPGQARSLSVALPRKETIDESELTLAIVYAGHGAIKPEELPPRPKDDRGMYFIRRPDAMMGCRMVEASVNLEATTKTEHLLSPD